MSQVRALHRSVDLRPVSEDDNRPFFVPNLAVSKGLQISWVPALELDFGKSVLPIDDSEFL